MSRSKGMQLSQIRSEHVAQLKKNLFTFEMKFYFVSKFNRNE